MLGARTVGVSGVCDGGGGDPRHGVADVGDVFLVVEGLGEGDIAGIVPFRVGVAGFEGLDDGTAGSVVRTEIVALGKEGGGVGGPGTYVDGINVWVAGIDIAVCVVEVRDFVRGTGVMHLESPLGVNAQRTGFLGGCRRRRFGKYKDHFVVRLVLPYAMVADESLVDVSLGWKVFNRAADSEIPS